MADNSNKPPQGNLEQAAVQPLLVSALLVLLVLSALAVAWLSQQSRHRFSELENLRKEQYRLDAEWTQLMLERGTLLSLAHVERVAVTRLKMRRPESNEVVVVRQ